MENITSPRRGRKGKAVAVPNAVAEGQDASSLDTGNGEVSGVQPEARAIDGGQGESWAEFVSRLTDPYLRKVWHPAPETELIQRDHAAWLPVDIGPKQGQLQDGTIVDLS